MTSIIVAIAGGTGTIGAPIARALLSASYFPHTIKRVVVLSRNNASPVAEELKKLGAEIESRLISDSDVLAGVDVLINALGQEIPAAVKNSYVKAAVEAGVKVYLPSEYGAQVYLHFFVLRSHRVDNNASCRDHYTLHLDHKVLRIKEDHFKYAHEIGGDKLKIVALCNGAFLSSSFYVGPMLGLDIKGRRVTSIGPATQKISFAETVDIAASAARLTVLAIQDPSSVPEIVRISGSVSSFAEIAKIFGEELGEKIDIVERDLEEVKANLGPGDVGDFISLVFALGMADFSKENHNELVNPGEKYWRWKTVAQFAKEAKGNPPTM